MTSLADRAGEELGVGEWMTVDQDTVDGFADITGDHQWIHQAGERADNGPFGGPIAHGFLTLALVTTLTRDIMSKLTDGVVMAINYGMDKVRFITPVRVGSRVRARVKLAEVKPIENGNQVKTEVTIEIDGSERPAAYVEFLARFYG